MCIQMEQRTRPAASELLPLLRALHLASPSLPIGAYAYSQGAEYAVEAGWISDEKSSRVWLLGLLEDALPQVDLPLLCRLYRAARNEDEPAFERYSQMVLACRESAELQAEEQNLGTSLARVLHELGITRAGPWVTNPDTTYIGMFAVGCAHYSISKESCLASYTYAWLEHQVSASARLVPLGQMAAQRIIDAGLRRIPGVIERALLVDETEIGFSAPLLQLASARHESQYTRLFRS